MDVKLAEDKMSAELSRSANLPAGDYTVKVNDLEAVSLKIEAQKVASIEFLGGDLIKAASATPGAAATSATFRYVVRDQYGVDMTKSVPQTAFTRNSIVGSTTVQPTLVPSTGVGRIDKTYADTDKTAVVTLVHNATGVNTTVTLNIAAAATVQSLEFGEVQLPTNKTRIEAGINPAATVPVTVKDQYGNDIKDLATLNSALMLISSDTSVSYEFALVDEKPVIRMNAASLTLPANVNSRNVVLTVVTRATGTPYSLTLEVVKAVAPHSIELGELSKEVVAVGDTIRMPIVVTNQFGDQLTAAQVVANAATIVGAPGTPPTPGWITGNSHIGAISINSNRDSAHYGKLEFTADTVGTDVLVINTPAGLTTRNIEVKAARKVVEVRNIDSKTLLQGATSKLEFKFFDQYQEEITSQVAGHNNGELKWEIKLDKISGDNNAILVEMPAPGLLTGDDELSVKEIPVRAATNLTGSYKVTLNLLDATTDAVVSSASTTVTAAKNNVAGLTYTVKEIPVLAGNVAGYDVSSPYAAKVVVEAKDAAGTVYVINPADVIGVTSSNAAVAGANTDGTDWFVFGADVSGSANTENKKATITVKINTLDGFKNVTSEVTVSPVAPQVQEIRVINTPGTSTTAAQELKTALEGDGLRRDTLPTSITNKTVYTLDNVDDITTPIYVVGKDQYGVWKTLTEGTNAAPITAIVNSTNHAPFNAFQIATANIGLTVGGRAAVTTEKDILVTLTNGLGSQQITVRVNGATVASKTTLGTNITNATDLNTATNAGTGVGQAPQAAKNALTAAIATATLVRDNANATQAQVNTAIADLAAAVTTFQAAIVPAT